MGGCANCHPALLGSSGGKKAHPAGNNIKFSAAVAANYNAYVASGGRFPSRWATAPMLRDGTSDALEHESRRSLCNKCHAKD
jgi:hypothetical protein